MDVAVKQRGCAIQCAIQYASDELKNDKEFILSIIKLTKNSNVLKYINYGLRNDINLNYPSIT